MSQAIPNFRPPIFQLENSAEWKKYLEDEGFAVIGPILTQERRAELLQEFWRDWNSITPNFDPSNGATWGSETAPLAYHEKGMAISNGLGHTTFIWELRKEPRIQQIFKTLHKTEHICTSLDGFSVFYTHKQNPKLWLHVDQHPKNPTYCIQGAYNFFASERNDAGFVVVPKSHNRTLETNAESDWVIINDSAIEKEAVKISIPENSFVIWNSRTIHANAGMKKAAKGAKTSLERSFSSNPPALNRLTCYITFMPKSQRPESVLEQKKKAYLTSQCTSHWANRCEVKKFNRFTEFKIKKWTFGKIAPLVTEDGQIPPDRLDLL